MATEPHRIALLRHGEAESAASNDAARALTTEGRREAQATALALRSAVTGPVRVVSSPFRRAHETAAIIAAVLAVPAPAVLDGLTPGDRPARALQVVDSALEPSTTLVVVTHMPLVGALLGLLVDGDERRARAVGTACGSLLVGEVVAAGLMREYRALHPYAGR